MMLPSTRDAYQRAWRTFLQGLLVDLAVILLPLAADAFLAWDGAGGRVYWTAVGLSLAKTAATTVAAYVMRKLRPPKQ